MTKRCCVIGGGGFIGRPVVSQLIQAGYAVRVIDRANSEVPEGAELVAGDYADRDFLTAALQGVDELVHLAYASVPTTSFEDPSSDLLRNIPPALTLFEVASALSLQKLLFVSSGGTVYGQAKQLPISEDHPTNPISPYGITKLAIEKYAGLFWALKGLPVVIVRPANAYGELQRPYTGQGLVATAVASMMDDKEIQIFGEEGSVRDYIHVDDIAAGIVAALCRGSAGEVYNLGTGIGSSSKDVLGILAGFAHDQGLKPKITHLPARGFDVAQNILDCSKIHTETGWEAKVHLAEGLRRTWEYQVSMHG